ncbi:hypothetical protein DAEQUDRAFT_661533 [Daedalea quercina L-15889]|uniref:Uncharacterized protein n=1 Tax=Daedalea quercina L-15889 TaxID=1314783 RepID=A0A165TR36_9APHY|nr:hypothetical protein DAEQUDRAFT_661533 [Daedalea quercina L-15889]
MSPTTYESLKAVLLPLIEQLFDFVVVPPEAPEKADYGDLDFVVTSPRSEDALDRVQVALRAAYSLRSEGRGTSNFAMPANAFDLAKDENQGGALSQELQNTYIQVDVNVCPDKETWERTVFLHAYGDTGMILGVIGRAAGVSLGVNGLKLANPLPTNPPVSFHLSTSLPRILEFYGLSKDRLSGGFATQREVFDWIATSRLFNARKVAPAEQSHARGKKRRGPRTMYQSFLEYARERADDPTYVPPSEIITEDDVLHFFGKEAEHAALIRAFRVKQNAREVFSGKAIERWIGMKGLPVKWVMDIARERLTNRYAREHPTFTSDDGEAIALQTQPGNGLEVMHLAVTPWEVALFEMSIEEVQQLIVDVKAEMEGSGTFELNWQRENARKAEKRGPKPEQ